MPTQLKRLNGNFLLQQNNSLRSFSMEKITFQFYSRECTFTLLSPLLFHFDSIISDVKHESLPRKKIIYISATIENGFAEHRINICFVNRESRVASCITETNAIKHRSMNRNFFLPAATVAVQNKYFTLFELVSIMTSRHTTESCQLINSMPLSLSSTCLSKDKVTTTTTATIKWNETESRVKRLDGDT